jgi:hypothetical protein
MYTGDKEVILPEHRENLDKLASYLESLPADYDHFNIRAYFALSNFDGYPEQPCPKEVLNMSYKVTDCGTVACAIGHGPAAGIPLANNDHDWSIYSKRVFGRDEVLGYGRYMFNISNEGDHYDAANRIREILALPD